MPLATPVPSCWLQLSLEFRWHNSSHPVVKGVLGQDGTSPPTAPQGRPPTTRHAQAPRRVSPYGAGATLPKSGGTLRRTKALMTAPRWCE